MSVEDFGRLLHGAKMQQERQGVVPAMDPAVRFQRAGRGGPIAGEPGAR